MRRGTLTSSTHQQVVGEKVPVSEKVIQPSSFPASTGGRPGRSLVRASLAGCPTASRSILQILAPYGWAARRGFGSVMMAGARGQPTCWLVLPAIGLRFWAWRFTPRNLYGYSLQLQRTVSIVVTTGVKCGSSPTLVLTPTKSTRWPSHRTTLKSSISLLT